MSSPQAENAHLNDSEDQSNSDAVRSIRSISSPPNKEPIHAQAIRTAVDAVVLAHVKGAAIADDGAHDLAAHPAYSSHSRAGRSSIRFASSSAKNRSESASQFSLRPPKGET